MRSSGWRRLVAALLVVTLPGIGRDGAVFGNYERLLPPRDRGYYREYTVATPGATDRGARRIVAGRDGERYYNWDALADSLADVSWRLARGYVVFCRRGGEFVRRSQEDFATALAILDAAASYWRDQGKVFLALLDAETSGSEKLKPLLA